MISSGSGSDTVNCTNDGAQAINLTGFDDRRPLLRCISVVNQQAYSDFHLLSRPFVRNPDRIGIQNWHTDLDAYALCPVSLQEPEQSYTLYPSLKVQGDGEPSL
jgi:hypothetical protein